MDQESTATNHRLSIFSLSLLVAVFLFCGWHFALAQNVWIDESTQLSGMTLNPVALLQWLAGMPEPSFGVPPDRAPPLSYLIDMACDRTLCSTPLHFRILHLFIAAAGVGILLFHIDKLYGLLAMAVSGALIVVSPKLTEVGVEIRSYPIFFTITCLQIAVLARVTIKGLTPGLLLAMYATGLAAIYTHFFGLVSTFAFWVGLLSSRLARPRDVWTIVGIGGCLLLTAGGIMPFVMASRAISTTPVEVNGIPELVTYGFKLVGHPSHMVALPVAVIFFGSLVVLLLKGLLSAAPAILHKTTIARDSLAWVLSVSLLVGVSVTVCAGLFVHSFNALIANYSIWALPVVATLTGAAVLQLSANGSWIAKPAGILLVLSAVWAQVHFLRNSEQFVHGPSSAIIARIGDPIREAVIYRGAWGYGFFPLYYKYKDELPQFVLGDDGTLRRLLPGGGIGEQIVSPESLSQTNKLILVNIRTARFYELRNLKEGSASSDGINHHGMHKVLALSGWTVSDQQSLPGLYWSDITELHQGDAQ